MVFRPPRKRQVATRIDPELWFRLERVTRRQRVTLAEYLRGGLTRHLTHLPDSEFEDEGSSKAEQ